IVFIDPDTMALSPNTAAIPPCVTRIARDPLGDGMIVFFGEATRSIARYDASGALVERRDISIPGLGPGHFGEFARTLPGAPALIAIVYRLGPDDQTTQFVVTFDATTFAVRTVTPFEGKLAGLAAKSADVLGVVNDHTDRVYTIDLRA